MDEEVVAERHAELQISEEAKMRLGKGFGKSLAPGRGGGAKLCQTLRVDAVGPHGLFATVLQPMIEAPRLREEIEQNGLVIALEKIRVEVPR